MICEKEKSRSDIYLAIVHGKPNFSFAQFCCYDNIYTKLSQYDLSLRLLLSLRDCVVTIFTFFFLFFSFLFLNWNNVFLRGFSLVICGNLIRLLAIYTNIDFVSVNLATIDNLGLIIWHVIQIKRWRMLIDGLGRQAALCISTLYRDYLYPGRPRTRV